MQQREEEVTWEEMEQACVPPVLFVRSPHLSHRQKQPEWLRECSEKQIIVAITSARKTSVRFLQRE